MNCSKLLGVGAVCALFCRVGTLRAQSPYLYHLTMQGTCYQTNGSGDFVSIPITHPALVQVAAQSGGVSTRSIVLVYHMQSSGLGDAIGIVDRNSGTRLVNLFGLYFGDDASLGRSGKVEAEKVDQRGSGILVDNIDRV